MNTKIGTTELYRFCNKHRLFTCGTSRQYDKMFEIVRDGVTQTELAYILYICSDCRLNDVYDMITPLFNGGEK
jgi:hypothetical protein